MTKYLFQDYLELEIDPGKHRQYDRYFDNEYIRINETNVAKNKPTHKVRLQIVDNIPNHLDKNSVIRKGKFKHLFTFEYAVLGAGTKDVTIYFKHHSVSKLYVTAVGVFIQAQVLEPLMYWSFLKQNIFFMHSAGVSKDRKAYVFPAYGGTGKTTTSMSLLTKGYSFMGDDLLIIDPGKKLVFPYPRPLHIFTYNVQNLNGAKIPFATKFIIYFKNVVRWFLERILRTEFLISTRIHADEVIDNLELSEPATLHNVIFLKKKGDHESVKLNSMTKIKEHAKNIVESADLNESLFKLMDDKKLTKQITNLEVSVASNMLKNANYFGYLNTRKINLKKVDLYLNNVEVD